MSGPIEAKRAILNPQQLVAKCYDNTSSAVEVQFPENGLRDRFLQLGQSVAAYVQMSNGHFPIETTVASRGIHISPDKKTVTVSGGQGPSAAFELGDGQFRAFADKLHDIVGRSLVEDILPDGSTELWSNDQRLVFRAQYDCIDKVGFQGGVGTLRGNLVDLKIYTEPSSMIRTDAPTKQKS